MWNYYWKEIVSTNVMDVLLFVPFIVIFYVLSRKGTWAWVSEIITRLDRISDDLNNIKRMLKK